MNAYQKSISLGLTGTDAEIAATLKGFGLTVSPIVLSDLLFLLNFRGMLTKLVSNNADEKWAGSVLAMKAALVSAGSDAVLHVDRWLSHITNPRNTHWDTTDPNYAKPFHDLFLVFDQSGIFAEGDFEAIAALGGGWVYESLTTEIYSSLRESAEAAVALAESKAELESIADTAYANFVGVYNAAKAGIVDGSLTTPEQVAAILEA